MNTIMVFIGVVQFFLFSGCSNCSNCRAVMCIDNVFATFLRQMKLWLHWSEHSQFAIQGEGIQLLHSTLLPSLEYLEQHYSLDSFQSLETAVSRLMFGLHLE